jgi:glycosyltransferase involved in cell wall biosynthesis
VVEERLSCLKPDVIGIAGWTAAESLAALCWARREGRAIVVMSDSQAHDSRRRPLREAVKRRVVSACDAALVAAEPHRSYVLKLGIPEEFIFLGYDVVDNAHFGTGADLARREAQSLRVLHRLPERYLLASSRFIPKKNLPGLVAAFSRACKDREGPDLVILGDGVERPLLEQLIRDHGIGHRVHLLGFWSYELLPTVYGLAEAFIHVPHSEQWGLVINEAAAAGLPIVASYPCGAASVLVEEGRNGWLVDPSKIDDIAAAIADLVSSGAECIAAMGQESRRMVAHWDLGRFATGLKLACEAAVTRPPRHLMPWDEVLIRRLGRRVIDTVP